MDRRRIRLLLSGGGADQGEGEAFAVVANDPQPIDLLRRAAGVVRRLWDRLTRQ